LGATSMQANHSNPHTKFISYCFSLPGAQS
jgi:hypothetical protein